MLTLVLALVLGLLVVFGVAVSVAFRSFYLDEIENRLLRELDDVNEVAVNHYMDVDKRTAAREEFYVLVRQFDAYLQIVFDSPDLGRYSVYDSASGDRWANAEEAELDELVREVKADGHERFSYGLLTKYTGFYTLTVMRPVTDADGRTHGVIFFHYDMTGVNGSIRSTLKTVAMLSGIAILIAIPLVTLLVRGVTHPISHMTDVVRDFTRGDFSRRVKVRGRDELSNLGMSFNAMADELNTLEEARRSFVANVSHELRSPLTSMRGFLEAMTDGTIPPDEYESYIEIVLDENRRMTVMVNDLLDLARIESGQYKISPAPFDITELVRRTVITFEQRIHQKGFTVEVRLPDEPLYADADEARIAQVLHNLVDNAVKYTPERGRLCVGCTQEKHLLRVRVENSGPGIPQADLPHVFDRFYKAEKAHTPSGTSGTGLGLSIAKLIIDQHGQQLTADSRDGLTWFEFTLKRAKKPARDEKNEE